MKPDESLLVPRKVVRSIPEDDGIGHSMLLECGHEVVTLIAPQDEYQCAICLEQLIKQCREVQAAQRPREQ